jgi:hypothetical protein
MDGLRDILRRLLPTGLLVLLVIVPYWKLTTMQGVMITDDVFTSDLMNDGFPYRMYFGEALKQGEFPLWYPPVYGGFPLVARAESGVCSPSTIFFFGLFPPYHALNLYILFTLVTAGIGMFLFAREISGSVAGGLVAGISFSWSGFMVCHIKHLSMLGTVSLFPLALLALERATAERGNGWRSRPMLLFSLLFGLQILSGHIQTAYYAGLVYVAYALLRLWPRAEKPGRGRKPASRWRRFFAPPVRNVAAGVVVAFFVAVGLGAVQLLPTYELVGLSQRAEGVTFEYAADYSYEPANAITFAVPYANGDVSDGSYTERSVFWEDYGYAGAVVLLLALLAVVVQRTRWHVKFFAVAAVGAYLIVLGSHTPVFGVLFHLVPGMKYFRFPTRFLFLVDASLAVLAAFGMGWLSTRLRTLRPAIVARAVPVVIVVCAAADVITMNLRQNPVADMAVWSRPPRTAVQIRADSGDFRIYSPGASEVHRAAFARARGWSGDLSPYVRQREFLQPSSNVLYGLSSADGYAQLTPNHVVDVWGDQNRKGGLVYSTASVQNGVFLPTQAFVHLISLAGVRYVLTPWPLSSPLMDPVDSTGGVYLSRNPSALARAYIAAEVRTAVTPGTARALLASPEFRPGHDVILPVDLHLPPPTANDEGSAHIISSRSNEVVVRTSTAVERLLVLADTDYPGWVAEVDGKATTIYRANLTQRAVVVPAGEHLVRFVFEAPTVRYGALITLLSAVLVLGGLCIPVRRKSEGG